MSKVVMQNVGKIFAGILLIGLIGLGLDQLFRLLHRKAFPWLQAR